MMPPDMQRRFLSQEPFVQGWPPRTERGGSAVQSLFEGLDGSDG